MIKVEGPARLDVSRGGNFSGVYPDNEIGDDPWNRTSTFNLLNRGKKSLALDLRRPEGREILKDLIRVSDVLDGGFYPAGDARLGAGLPERAEAQPGT